MTNSDLQRQHEIRHYQNNINAWKFRQSLFGENWAEAIAHAQAKLVTLKN